MKNIARIFLFLTIFAISNESSAFRIGFNSDEFSQAQKIMAGFGVAASIGVTLFQYYRARTFQQSENWKPKNQINESYELQIVRDAFDDPDPDQDPDKKISLWPANAQKQFSFFPFTIENSIPVWVTKEQKIHEIRVENATAHFGSLFGSIGSVPKVIGLCALFGFAATKMLRSPGK
jgi:hypothetical protein